MSAYKISEITDAMINFLANNVDYYYHNKISLHEEGRKIKYEIANRGKAPTTIRELWNMGIVEDKEGDPAKRTIGLLVTQFKEWPLEKFMEQYGSQIKKINISNIKIGDWIMEAKDIGTGEPPYIVTKVTKNDAYGEIPVRKIKNHKINLEGARKVR